MATIILQYAQKVSPGAKDRTLTGTATVSRSPGLHYYETVKGKLRTFDFVGVDASGNRIYRDMNRRG